MECKHWLLCYAMNYSILSYLKLSFEINGMVDVHKHHNLSKFNEKQSSYCNPKFIILQMKPKNLLYCIQELLYNAPVPGFFITRHWKYQSNVEMNFFGCGFLTTKVIMSIWVKECCNLWNSERRCPMLCWYWLCIIKTWQNGARERLKFLPDVSIQFTY